MLPNNDRLIDLMRSIYGDGQIPLHRPVFEGREYEYLRDCVESNFVSSVGRRVTEFEHVVASYTGAQFAVATVNGTAALHVALNLVGAGPETEVITQALTFVATCNAITYVGAHPVFVDVDLDTMSMSPLSLKRFLATHVERRGSHAWNKLTGRRVVACLPMHTFGLPGRVEEIAAICDEWHIALVEDAAESLGSFVGVAHTGTFGKVATLSFNGNKVVTTGGGGMILTNDEALGLRAKHLTTTAKIPHPFEFVHDEVGYNYRLPNLNAALGCAQMERLKDILRAKAEVARRYQVFFEGLGVPFAMPRPGTTTNFWLNAITLPNRLERDELLAYTNENGVMTRPIWRLMTHLRMFSSCQHDGLDNSRWLEERVVNLPSSVPDGALPLFAGSLL